MHKVVHTPHPSVSVRMVRHRGLKHLSSGCIAMAERVDQAEEYGGWGVVVVVIERGCETPGECKSGQGHPGEWKMPK